MTTMHTQVDNGVNVEALLGARAALADTPEIAAKLAQKIWTLRILADERSAADLDAPLLVVSQFTLYADARNGRRPSFSAAAAPEAANAWYEEVAALLRGHGLTVETGRFQSHMQVDLCNDGPVTLLLDSQKQF